MANFPIGFPELFDAGGGGQGRPLGGFGGNASKDQAHHRAFIKASGKAPVVLVHGNTGTATHPQWGWLKVVDYLKHSCGYADEHFWALSYLGSGERQLNDPYTSNIEDLRIFTDTVRSYLDVACLDMVGHSLGCHLVLCYLAGLKKQAAPIAWDQGLRYANVGTVVLIDGAMHGLRAMGSIDNEWLPDGDIYDCLSPDNTPFGLRNDPTPAPAHNLKYWCCMVPGGYVDGMDLLQGTTGHLEGADENRNYNSGSGIAGHEKVKDDPSVIADWAPYLNSVPPVDPVAITVDKESGNYAGALTITVAAEPPTALVDYTATRITRQIVVGALESQAVETLTGSLHPGAAVTLATPGMWEVLLDAPGATPVRRTYGVDVTLPQVSIITDNSVDFENSLVVMAQADSGTLYLNVGGSAAHGWEPRASVTITQDTMVQAIALTAEGLASDIVSKTFHKAVPWTEQAVGTVTEHYVAGRLDVNGYLRYGSKYGYIQSFMLYRIDGQWTDNPETVSQDRAAPVAACSPDSGNYNQPVTVQLSAVDAADPAPRIYYTTDETTPTTGSAYFVNQGSLQFNTPGRKVLKYMARDRSGNTTAVETRTYGLEIGSARLVISSDRPPGVYDRAITVVLRAADYVQGPVTVHYTLDGSVPDAGSPSFVESKPFTISTNGNHAISCWARDHNGHEIREIFYFVIRDNLAPNTTIFPNGGLFSDRVEVSLNSEEPVVWTRYTTDGSDPGEANGRVYEGAFALTETTTVKYRSLDKQGNLEAVKSVLFTRGSARRQAVFENIADVDGYIKANPDGSFRSVVDYVNLAVGAGWDGRISRSIVSFDTSSLPQAAVITRACLQVKCDYVMGDPWEGRQLQIDVKRGKFGSATICQTGDWDEPATAVAVATIVPFSQGNQDSSNFNAAGREAINRSGRTQMRLYFDPHFDMGPCNYLFLTKGKDVKLIVEYTAT
jgi:pimeloyl-ACP methyl ester carboxylesterase